MIQWLTVPGLQGGYYNLDWVRVYAFCERSHVC